MAAPRITSSTSTSTKSVITLSEAKKWVKEELSLELYPLDAIAPFDIDFRLDPDLPKEEKKFGFVYDIPIFWLLMHFEMLFEKTKGNPTISIALLNSKPSSSANLPSALWLNANIIPSFPESIIEAITPEMLDETHAGVNTLWQIFSANKGSFLPRKIINQINSSMLKSAPLNLAPPDRISVVPWSDKPNCLDFLFLNKEYTLIQQLFRSPCQPLNDIAVNHIPQKNIFLFLEEWMSKNDDGVFLHFVEKARLLQKIQEDESEKARKIQFFLKWSRLEMSTLGMLNLCKNLPKAIVFKVGGFLSHMETMEELNAPVTRSLIIEGERVANVSCIVEIAKMLLVQFELRRGAALSSSNKRMFRLTFCVALYNFTYRFKDDSVGECKENFAEVIRDGFFRNHLASSVKKSHATLKTGQEIIPLPVAKSLLKQSFLAYRVECKERLEKYLSSTTSKKLGAK